MPCPRPRTRQPMVDRLRRLLSPEHHVLRTRPSQARTPPARVRYNEGADGDMAFIAVPSRCAKFDKLDRANRWLYYGLHACGLARPLRTPPAVGHRNDHSASRTRRDQHHHAAARLPPPEVTRHARLEMGCSLERSCSRLQTRVGPCLPPSAQPETDLTSSRMFLAAKNRHAQACGRRSITRRP